jgi:hypothetical protein
MKVYHDFKQTMVEPNISEGFQAIGFGCGFEFDTDGEPYGQARFLRAVVV